MRPHLELNQAGKKKRKEKKKKPKSAKAELTFSQRGELPSQEGHSFSLPKGGQPAIPRCTF